MLASHVERNCSVVEEVEELSDHLPVSTMSRRVDIQETGISDGNSGGGAIMARGSHHARCVSMNVRMSCSEWHDERPVRSTHDEAA
jgi:hypothetical protein